jgi:sacsin
MSFQDSTLAVTCDPILVRVLVPTTLLPGLKIAFANSPLLAQFPDQFSGYLGTFGCDLNSAYPATLFRFPLRSVEVGPG